MLVIRIKLLNHTVKENIIYPDTVIQVSDRNEDVKIKTTNSEQLVNTLKAKE